jgi:hypothetical protein
VDGLSFVKLLLLTKCAIHQGCITRELARDFIADVIARVIGSAWTACTSRTATITSSANFHIHTSKPVLLAVPAPNSERAREAHWKRQNDHVRSVLDVMNIQGG